MDTKKNERTARRIVGSKGQYNDTARTWRVTRRGGHPTAWLLAMMAKIRKAGFKEQPRPDSRWSGDNVTHLDLFIHKDGRRAAISRYIGTTKQDNSYTVIVDTVPSLPVKKTKTVRIPKIKSLGELRRLATTDPRYLQLAICAVENLGGSVGQKDDMQPGDRAYTSALEMAMRYLNLNADETDSEQGVVDEVNFVRDVVR